MFDIQRNARMKAFKIFRQSLSWTAKLPCLRNYDLFNWTTNEEYGGKSVAFHLKPLCGFGSDFVYAAKHQQSIFGRSTNRITFVRKIWSFSVIREYARSFSNFPQRYAVSHRAEGFFAIVWPHIQQLTNWRTRRCAHYDCDALWIQNFQDGGEGREISQVICFIFQ